MSRINHEEVLKMVIAKYEKENGEPGLAKADVDAMVYGLGGNKDDIYTVMEMGMELFFGDVVEPVCYLN